MKLFRLSSRRSGSSLGALALATALFVQPAFASSYCSDGSLDGLSLHDMTFNGALATNCYGVVMGNDKQSAINSLAWSNDWTFLTKDEAMQPAAFMGIKFTLDTSGNTAGTWTLTGMDINGAPLLNLPAELDLVAVLKAGNRYAAYFFDDAVIDGTDGGTWSIAFENNGGQIPNLSHMSLYVRIDEDGGIPAAIPEVQTYADAGRSLPRRLHGAAARPHAGLANQPVSVQRLPSGSPFS